jgi:hypothetical protein
MTIPLRRRPGRLLYRLFHHRSHHHGYDTFPFLEFQRDADGRWSNVIYRGKEVARLRPHAEATRLGNGPVVVVGAGPSLSTQRLSRLRERSCILTNGAISLIESHRLDPVAVVIEDEGFVHSWPGMVAGLAPDTPCFFSPAVIRAVCEIDPSLLGNWRLFLVEILHKPIGRPRPTAEQLGKLSFVRTSSEGAVHFSCNTERGFGSCGTVAYCAVQLALACAPSHLGIAGVDLSGFDRPRFHERRSRTTVSHLRRRLPSILAGFRLTAEICRERGIATSNYSSQSLVPANDFPYDDWLDAD